MCVRRFGAKMVFLFAVVTLLLVPVALIIASKATARHWPSSTYSTAAMPEEHSTVAMPEEHSAPDAVRSAGNPISSKSQTRTILMSYMRSGSSFTGDLLQLSPDVMYHYEPLHYTQDVDVLPRNTPIRSRVDKKHRDKQYLPETQDFGLSTLKCNLSVFNLNLLEYTEHSKSYYEYRRCMKTRRDELCSQSITSRCRRSSHVVSKILRLRMWEVDDMLSRDPGLKVIHLVRDPRGISQSRAHFRWADCNPDTFCKRLTNDALLSMELKKKYPDRLRTVRYEDIASNPVRLAHKLYQFAGIDWTSQIEDKVRGLTGNDAGAKFDLKWRSKIEDQKMSAIQTHCKGVMYLYGYISFESQQQKLNKRVPSVTKEYAEGFNKLQ